jgi:alkylation response protein AidB-like acyl-CoA dehydrogenase
VLAAPEIAPPRARREEFRSTVDAHVAPRADRWDLEGRIPPEALELAEREGWWGAPLPADVGGTGMDWVTVGALHEEVGRGCSSLRSLLTVHTMASASVERWGSREQRERWLPALASGGVIGAFCLTEPGAGSDAAAITTTARPRRDGFALVGKKVWITGGQVAGVYLVFARHGSGISAFLVPRDAPGLTIEPVEGALGTRASMLAELTFEDCALSADALLGPPGLGLAAVGTSALDIGRYSVACGSVGIVGGALEASARHAAGRAHRGGLLKDEPLVRRMLTDMVVALRSGRLLCEYAGRLKDERDPGTIIATWIAKYEASRAAARSAADAVQIHGASGCAAGHAVGRYYRDAKVMEIIEGSTELQQMTIADDAFRAL